MVTNVLGSLGLTSSVRHLELCVEEIEGLLAEDLEVFEAIGPPSQALTPAWSTSAATAPIHYHITGLAEQPAETANSEPAEGWAGQRLIIHALSTNTHISLKQLIGQPLSIDMRTQDGSLRRWSATITQASLLGSDGALARYKLIAQPWLALAAHRQDSRIYQNQSVIQIIDTILGSYRGQGTLHPQWRWELQNASIYPQRSLCTQYRESDLAFIHRLLREEGIFYWWQHQPDEQHPTLILADHNGALPDNRHSRVRYSQTAAVLREDSLVRYHASAVLCSSSLQQASLDYRTLQQRLQNQTTLARAASTTAPSSSGLPRLDIIDQPGQYLWPDNIQGQRLSERQIQALDAWARQSSAAGSWRDAAAGSTFTLTDHPQHTGHDEERDCFVIVRAHHRTRNNLRADIRADIEQRLGPLPTSQLPANHPENRIELNPPSAEAAPQQQEAQLANNNQPLHWVRLGLQPARLPVRATPLLDAQGQPDIRLHGKPTVTGVQTAIVVGLSDNSHHPIHSDREGRIKVQFHWQRGSQSSSRLQALHHETDNAPASQQTGTWVRVLQTQAGSNWGSHYTPRLGQEVLIGYLHNDIDRPVVLGSLYNGQGEANHTGNRHAQGAAGSTGNAPGWFPGQEENETAPASSRNSSSSGGMPIQNHRHNAVLSGYKSQELSNSPNGRGGYNQIVIDSSASQGRLEIASSPDASGQHASRLQLGYLLHQSDNRRQQARGHGLDLSTPDWGAVRAGSGLLISSHSQTASHQGDGQQLHSEEAQQELTQARQLLQTLAADAQKHNAQASENEPAIPTRQQAQQQPGNSNTLPADSDLQALLESLAQSRSSESAQDADAQATAEAAQDMPAASQQVGGGHGSIHAWSAPDLLLSSPHGIHSASSGQSLFACAGSYSAIARQHINQLASGQYTLNSARGIVLYTLGQNANKRQPVKEEGIRLHAATGSVVVQAQNNSVEASAKHKMSVHSTNGSVHSGASGHQLLAAGGSAIEMKDGNITLVTTGIATFKSSQKVLTGPLSVNLPPMDFPSVTCIPCFINALQSGSAIAKVS